MNSDTDKVDDEDRSLTENNESNDAVTESPYKPLVAAPRSVWFDFFLGLLTFTLSWSFWMVGRARDVKRMRSNDYEPWLWFFSPLIVLATIISFPRMFGELREIERDRINTGWKNVGGFWVLALVLSSFIASIPDEILGNEWLTWVCLGFVNILFCLLHRRFTRLKKHDNALLEFTGRTSWYTWWEWLLLITGGTITALGTFFLWQTEQAVIDDLPVGYHYKNTEHKFQLGVDGPSWREMAIGTNSAGAAIVEFSNTSSSAYLLVFKHDKEESLNSLASFRYQDMQPDFTSPPDCRETRKLSEHQKFVESVSICKNETKQDREISVSKLIKVDDHYYEMLGFAVESKYTYKKTKEILLQASDSFSILPTEEKE